MQNNSLQHTTLMVSSFFVKFIIPVWFGKFNECNISIIFYTISWMWVSSVVRWCILCRRVIEFFRRMCLLSCFVGKKQECCIEFLLKNPQVFCVVLKQRLRMWKKPKLEICEDCRECKSLCFVRLMLVLLKLINGCNAEVKV